MDAARWTSECDAGSASPKLFSHSTYIAMGLQRLDEMAISKDDMNDVRVSI